MAGAWVTTAPSAILVVILLKIIAFGAAPFSACHMEIGRPARRALGARKHQDLVLEAHAAQFVAASRSRCRRAR